MTKEQQEKYISENIGSILETYRNGSGKNKLALLFDEGLLIVNLSEFLKGAEPKQRSRYKRFFKGLIRASIVPVISKDPDGKLVIYQLKRDERN